MKWILQAAAGGLLFFLILLLPVCAEEQVQNQTTFVKLDERGKELSRDAADWAMVLDTATGLIWEVKTRDGSVHDMAAGYDWEGAHEVFLAELNSMQFGGFSDWRLPTTEELRTIWVKGAEPSVDTGFFPNTRPSSYLSWRRCGSGEIFDERVKFGPVRNGRLDRQVRAVRSGGIVKSDGYGE
jgi:hypothetical protein